MKIIKKNKKKGDCGVVAAFNAASWCNLNKTYEEISKTAKSCGYNEKNGIYFFQFANLVKKLELPAKKVRLGSIEEIESRLYLGKFFIFLYTPTGQHTGHAIVAFTDHNGRIQLINPDNDRITWNEFAADIYAHGMKTFDVYEVPCRKLVSYNDDTRAKKNSRTDI